MARAKRKAPAVYAHPQRRDYADLPGLVIEIDGQKEIFTDYPAIARDYAESVVEGRTIACKWVKLACKRYMGFLERARKADNAFRYSPDHVCDVCSFLEKLPHVEGEWDVPTIVLEPWQIWMLSAVYGFIRKDGSRLTRWVYLEIPRKSAKALALDTPIPTPSGWTTMGEIKVGDEVFAADGSVSKVVAATEVMVDHDCYEVEFSNGEKIVADAGHQWLTTARVDTPGAHETKTKRRLARFREPSLKARKIGAHEYWYAQLYGRQVCLGRVGVNDAEIQRRFGEMAEADLVETPMFVDNLTRVRTTEEIAASVRYSARGDTNHSVDMPAPMALPAAALPIDPYVLGAWLGDGTTANGQITVGDEDAGHLGRMVQKAGYDVILRPRETTWLLDVLSKGAGGRIVNVRRSPDKDGLRAQLKRAGLIGNKHIPEAYLRGSFDQRLALLQGLMDTDGTCSPLGEASFTTTLPALRDGISELLATLGIKHSVAEKPMTCNGRPVEGSAYTVRFAFDVDMPPVFTLPRKLERARQAPKSGSARRSKTVQIVGCRKVASVPVRCIEIDHPSHLYLAGRTMVPTHNSTLIAGLALYTLTCSGEVGPAVYIGAPTLEQAGKVFAPASKMVRKEPDLAAHFGLRPRARKIYSDVTQGSIEVITSVGEHQDGHNPSMVILEELHAQNPDLYEVMRSSFGARKNPLLFQITTAGRVAQGICWDQRKRVVRVLEGVERADEVFGCIYTVDKEDGDARNHEKLFDERVIIKANPMWGVSVDPVKAVEFANEARGSVRMRGEFFRTRLNFWSNAAERLIQTEQWDACEDRRLRLERFRGAPAWIGVDLASRRDMAAKVVIIEDGEKLVVFPSFYVPTDCPAITDPDVGPLYRAWIDDYHVFPTGPGMIDFNMIKEDIREDCRFFDVHAIALDPYQAQQLAQDLVLLNLPAVLFPNTARNMTEPTDDLTSRVETGLLVHDGNPVLAWHASNTVGYEDQKGNVLPKKESPNSIYKIDGIAATVFANGCRLQQKEPDKKKKRLDVYSVRGFHGAEEQT